MSGSVQYMATTPRVEFSAHLAEAVIAAATALLTSERRSVERSPMSFRVERSSADVCDGFCGAVRLLLFCGHGPGIQNNAPTPLKRTTSQREIRRWWVNAFTTGPHFFF